MKSEFTQEIIASKSRIIHAKNKTAFSSTGFINIVNLICLEFHVSTAEMHNTCFSRGELALNLDVIA